MPRFLIEVPHEAETVACARAIQVLLSTGSHYLTNADFGCLDGDHKGWLIVEVDNRDEAKAILPPIYRSDLRPRLYSCAGSQLKNSTESFVITRRSNGPDRRNEYKTKPSADCSPEVARVYQSPLSHSQLTFTAIS